MFFIFKGLLEGEVAGPLELESGRRRLWVSRSMADNLLGESRLLGLRFLVRPWLTFSTQEISPYCTWLLSCLSGLEGGDSNMTRTYRTLSASFPMRQVHFKAYEGKRPQSRRLTASLFKNTHEIMKEKGRHPVGGLQGLQGKKASVKTFDC
eukprot:1153935-Pelagomonas_calceolata.AAC.1